MKKLIVCAIFEHHDKVWAAEEKDKQGLLCDRIPEDHSNHVFTNVTGESTNMYQLWLAYMTRMKAYSVYY